MSRVYSASQGQFIDQPDTTGASTASTDTSMGSSGSTLPSLMGGSSGGGPDLNKVFSLLMLSNPSKATVYKSVYDMLKPTAANDTRYANLTGALSSLDSAETNLVQAGGARGLAGYSALIPLLGKYFDPQGASYHNSKIELATQLAKAVTNSSRPAASVIDKYLNSLPDVTDPPAYAQAKLDKLRNEILTQAKAFNYNDLVNQFGGTQGTAQSSSQGGWQ